MIKEEEAPPAMAQWAGWSAASPAGFPEAALGGVLGGIIGSTPAAVPKVAATPQSSASAFPRACRKACCFIK